jgi:hypothetical protein
LQILFLRGQYHGAAATGSKVDGEFILCAHIEFLHFQKVRVFFAEWNVPVEAQFP